MPQIAILGERAYDAETLSVEARKALEDAVRAEGAGDAEALAEAVTRLDRLLPASTTD
jgi:hypothetical protein